MEPEPFLLRKAGHNFCNTSPLDMKRLMGDGDKVGYVGMVIRNKLLESETLQQQAASNSKEQFASSPDLARAQQDAIIDALDAHQAMSSQALNSPDLQRRMLELLLGNFNLWEGLREKAGSG